MVLPQKSGDVKSGMILLCTIESTGWLFILVKNYNRQLGCYKKIWNVENVGLAREPNRRAKTLGFALAKGLIRGLTRCPSPSLLILTCYPFLDVSYGVLTVPCCRYASMLLTTGDGRRCGGSDSRVGALPAGRHPLTWDPVGSTSTGSSGIARQGRLKTCLNRNIFHTKICT